ncbi:MAG: agmatinase [Candidatus Neomarinimicrobiota bacterium]
MKTYAGIEEEFAGFKKAAVLLQSIPYDGTSTWGKGADSGFEAFLEASENMELYDIETDSEVYKKGIHILSAISENASPEAVYKKVHNNTKSLLETDKFLTFFGGEHSISIGIIDAMIDKYPNITIVQLDAHADLRKDYLGSAYNHACALHRANERANLIQVGIRSMDFCEKQYLKNENCFFAQEIVGRTDWIQKALEKMTDKVYITVDLDVFDPSIMPSTGTPEPGGLDWYLATKFLKEIFKNKNVLGFDLVELAPIKDNKAPDFLAAKLYYKMLSYKFNKSEKKDE